MNAYSLLSDFPIFTKIPASTNRRARHRLLRKADILRAAEHVFAQKGYYSATVQDIAKVAQYAVGTVYLYFKDKDELYFSILDEKMSGFLSLLKERAEAAKSARAKIEVIIYENLSFFEKNQDFFRIFASEDNRWLIKNKILKLPAMLEHKEYFIGLIKKAQAESLIRSDMDAGQISGIFGSILTTVIFNWLQSDSAEKKDLKSMSTVISDMLFHGLKNKK